MARDIKKILDRIDELFTEKLSVKTGWGYKEVLRIYRESVNQALKEFIDQD